MAIDNPQVQQYVNESRSIVSTLRELKKDLAEMRTRYDIAIESEVPDDVTEIVADVDNSGRLPEVSGAHIVALMAKLEAVETAMAADGFDTIVNRFCASMTSR